MIGLKIINRVKNTSKYLAVITLGLEESSQRCKWAPRSPGEHTNIQKNTITASTSTHTKTYEHLVIILSAAERQATAFVYLYSLRGGGFVCVFVCECVREMGAFLNPWADTESVSKRHSVVSLISPQY